MRTTIILALLLGGCSASHGGGSTLDGGHSAGTGGGSASLGGDGRFTWDASTVSDSRTGLTWQRYVPATHPGCSGNGYSPGGKYCTWEAAKTYCASLALAGGGWRLPTQDELLSIVDTSYGNPAIDPAAFPNTPGEGFWSSSTEASYSSGDVYVGPTAWTIDFGTGISYGSYIDVQIRLVRCVRSMLPNHDAGTQPGDGGSHLFTWDANTVSDSSTGLTWQRNVPATYTGCSGNLNVAGDACTWDEAKAYCTGLSLAGTGWRLPTRDELLSIVDKRYSPTIDPTAFRSTPPDYFWSSSLSAGQSGYAWTVGFDYSSSNYVVTSRPYRVRCVR